jgi:HlyD family secretion protein
MKRKQGWLKYLLFGAVGAGLSALIAQSVLAGPQNRVTPRDIEQARNPVPPERGSDERSLLPAGDWVAGNGIIEPRERETKVAGEVPGRIAAIFVTEGQFVSSGSPLVELAGESERSVLAAAEADQEVAKAELTRTLHGMRQEEREAVVADTASLKARAELARDSLARTQALAKTGAATPDELDRAQRQAETDRASFEAAEARQRAAVAGSRAEDILMARAKVQAAQAHVREAKARLERLTIRAPLDGEILQLRYRTGEYYAPGADALIVMGDTRSLKVRVDIDERDVPRLALGAKGFVTSNAFPGRRVSGRVVELGRRMGRKNVRTDDPVERIDTKILEVRLELDDKTGLVPGLRVVGYVASAPR